MKVKPGLTHFKDILAQIPVAKKEWTDAEQKLKIDFEQNAAVEMSDDVMLEWQALERTVRQKKENYDNLIFEIGKIRSVVGIDEDKVILEFLDKMENLMPLSVRIHSR